MGAMAKKILVTGFGPFLDNKVNPTEILVRELASNHAGAATLEALVLPVEFHASVDLLFRKVHENDYCGVLLTGLAAGRTRVSLERVGLNWIDSEFKDEAGYCPPRGPISPTGPEAYFTKVAIDDYKKQLIQENLSVEISLSAGGYVCNHLYYRALQELTIPVLFVHFPMILENPESYKGGDRISWDGARRCLNSIVDLMRTR